MTPLPEPLGDMLVQLQLFCRAHDDDAVTVMLADLPDHVAGLWEKVGPRKHRIMLSRKQTIAAPLFAAHVLVHEWGHYLASEDERNYAHEGVWPEAAATAYRIAFNPNTVTL